MKNTLRLLLLCALCASVVNILPSCTTPVSQRQAAYDTLQTVGLAVQKSMDAYADLVAAGSITAEQQARVRDLYTRYRSAYFKAVDLAKLDLSTAPPAEVAQLAADIITLVASLAKH